MKMDLNLDLNVICRICLCDGDMRPLDSEVNGYSYKDKILQCTNIQLKSHTNFPELICNKCVDDLEIAYRFRMNCESSDAILKMYVDSKASAGPFVKTEGVECDDQEPGDHDQHDFECNESVYHTSELKMTDTEVVMFQKVASSQVKKEKQLRKVWKKSKTKEPTDGDNVKKPNQICELCGSQCRSNFEMKIHMRRHNNEKPYQCSFCEKMFAAYGGLKVHLRVHTGEKPYPCQHCDKKFADFTTRIKHERTHTGERPYACPHCERTFSYSHVLANHIMTHTGEKKFYCHICGKGFVKRHNLKIHQNVHLREEGKPVLATKKKPKPEATEASSISQQIIIDSPAVMMPIDSCEVAQTTEIVQVVEVRTEMTTPQFIYDV